MSSRPYSTETRPAWRRGLRRVGKRLGVVHGHYEPRKEERAGYYGAERPAEATKPKAPFPSGPTTDASAAVLVYEEQTTAVVVPEEAAERKEAAAPEFKEAKQQVGTAQGYAAQAEQAAMKARELQQEAQRLSDSADSATAEAASKAQRVRELEADMQSNAEEAESLTQQLRSLDEREAALTAGESSALAEGRRRVDDVHAEQAALQARMEEVGRDAERLEFEGQDLESQARKLHERSAALARDAEAEEARVQEVEEVLVQMGRHVAELQRQAGELMDLAEHRSGEAERLAQKMDASHGDAARDLHSKLCTARGESQRLLSEAEVVLNEQVSVEQRMAALLQQKQESAEKARALREQREMLISHAKTCIDLASRTMAAAYKQAEEYSSLRSRVAQLAQRSESGVIGEATAGPRGDLHSLNSERSAATERLRKLMAEMAKIEDEAAQLTHATATCTREAASLRTQAGERASLADKQAARADELAQKAMASGDAAQESVGVAVQRAAADVVQTPMVSVV